MSKLLKSKFLLGVLAVVFVLAATQVALAADGVVTMTLKKGMKNVQVKYLQQTLNEKGYTVATTGVGSAGKESTTFGPATVAAVKKFQAAMGLVADGVFGAKSRAALGGVATNPTTPTVPTTGPVAVMVATDNPASGTLVAGQATADLAHFTFTGAGTVTALTLQRIGVSADTTPSNVYLFDGATRLTDAASVTSTGLVTFTNPAGLFMGGKTVAVKSDIATGTSGQTLGMKLVSYTVGGVVTTANLSGNVHNIASATLATLSAGTVTPSGATINPASGVTLWQSTLTVSQRDVLMKRLALRQVGSAPASSFQNFKLYVNGVQVATSTGLDINGYVTFDMTSAPVTLVAGSRVVRVDADVVSGASRTVQLSVRQAADVDFVDSSFGVNITPTGFAWTGSASTISGSTGGSLTVEKDVTSPSTNLTLSGTDVNLGTFKLTAYGESIKVETLTAGFAKSDAATASLRNGRLLINGVQYGSTATLLPAGTSFTVNYTVVPGTPVLVEVHADIYDNDGTNDASAGDTYTAKLVTGSSNATRVDSLGSTNVPTADVSANTLTVATTAITLAKNGTYANQTTVVPATNFKIGSWNLTGSSVEDVLLTTLSFDITSVTNATFSAADITNMYVVVKNGSTIVAQPSPLGTVAATANNYSINYTLPKNGNVTIELFGNFGSTVTSGDSFKSSLLVSGTSLVSGQSVSTNGAAVLDGQTVAYGSATLTATKDASSPVASIVYDNQTVTGAAFKFAAVTSGYNVTDLVFTLANSTVVSMVELYDGSTLVASKAGASTVTFSGLAWNVPANTNKVLTAKLVLGGVGIGAGSTGTSQLLTLTDFTATNTSTGVADASANDAGPSIENNPAGSAMYAYASTPTITQLALPSTLLGTGTQTVAKFTVDSNGGTIGWKKFIFTVTRAMGGTDTLATPTLWDGSTQVTGTAAFTGGVEADGGTAGTITFVATDEQQINGSKTYTLKLVTAATLADGDNLNVSIANPSTYAASAAYATVAATTSSFSWTDTSASSHDATTLDWNNDYLVKNLPTDTWTLIK